MCVWSSSNVGVSCNATNKCETGGTCQSDGSCVGVQKTCTPSSNTCQINVCNPLTGECGFQNLSDGNSCNDGNQCTKSDRCVAGNCQGTLINFDDGNVCNGVETCVNGAVFVDPKTIPKALSSCDDGNPCTTKDQCREQNGKRVCVGSSAKVDDKNPCTTDSCNPDTGKIEHESIPVDDGNACTKDTCNKKTGGIVHTTINPDDGNPCTVDSCDPVKGVSHEPVDVPTACDDGDSCTEGDRCFKGKCKGVPQITAACGYTPPDPPVTNPLGPPLSRGETKEVGSISGSFSVSPNGAAVYSIPFTLPPGRAGMTPSLGLQYSSDQGNGLVGMGFSMTGLSSIHRCPANLAVHGYIKEVDYIKDELCLDGRPLVKVVEGVGTAEYRTLPDTFVKITGHYDAHSPRLAWLEARDKNGLIHFYGWNGAGADQGARPLAITGNYQSWLIYRTEDRFGNTISFHYDHIDTDATRNGSVYTKETYLSRVAYPPNNEVVFAYNINEANEPEDRPDSRFFFSKGMLLTRSKRLTRAEVYAGGEYTRSYYVSYEPTEIEGSSHHPSRRSRVGSLTECANDGVCKPSTLFTWNQGVAGFQGGDRPGVGPRSKGSAIFPIDLDRDGLDDLVAPDEGRVIFCNMTLHHGKPSCGLGVDCSQPNSPCEVNDCSPCEPGDECVPGAGADFCTKPCGPSVACPDGMVCSPVSDGNYCTSEDADYFPKDVVFWSSSGSLGQQVSVRTFDLPQLPFFLPFDYNGDKVPDLIVTNNYKFKSEDGGIYGQYYSALLGPNYNKIVNTHIRRPIDNDSNPDTNGATHLTDLDGNGFADFIQCWGQTSTDANDSFWTYRLHSGVSIDTVPNPQDFAWGSFMEEHSIPQLNGVRCKNLSFPMDVNTDGISEYIIFNNDPSQPAHQLRLTPVTSNAPGAELQWEPEVTNTNLYFSNYRDLPIFADVNGDGLKDIVTTSTGALSSELALMIRFNSGDGLFTVPAPVTEDFSKVYPGILAMGLVVDYNGDGLDDILVPNVTTVFWDALLSNGANFTRVSTNIRFEGRALGLNTPEETMAAAMDGQRVTRFQNYRVVDFTGDGIPDLVGVDRDGWLISRRSSLFEEDTLQSIDDGLRYKNKGDPGYKSTISISYEHLIDQKEFESSTGYQKGTSAACSSPWVDCVAGPKRVVRQFLTANGHGLPGDASNSEQNRFTLDYRDARYDRFGRQWLGFAQRTISQELIQGTAVAPSVIRVRDEFFDIDTKHQGIYPFAGQPYRTVSVTRGDVYSTHTYQEEISVRAVVDPAGAPFFVYTKDRFVHAGDAPSSSSFSTDFNVLQPTIHKSFEEHVDGIDDFGNVLKQTTKSDSLTTVVQTDFSNNTGAWLIGRPGTSTACQYSAAMPLSNGCVITQYQHDDKGYPTSVTLDPDRPDHWVRTSFWRDFFGNVSGTITQNNQGETRQSWVFFDEQGWYPSIRQNGLSHTSFEQYDRTLGVLTQALDPNGVLSQASYDSFGRLVRVVAPDGVQSTITRERFLEPTSSSWLTKVHSTSTLGHNSTQLFNNRGQVLSSSGVGFGGDRFYKAYSYDALGEHLAKESLPTKNSTEDASGYLSAISSTDIYTTQFDAAGRLIRAHDPDGLGTQYVYDPQGNTYAINPKQNVSVLSYDQAGRVATSLDTKQQSTSYTYGAFGSLVIVAPGDSGGGTILQTDRRGQVTYRLDPDRGEAFYEYNAFGDLVKEIHGNPKMYTTVYTYDVLGRPSSKIVQDHSEVSEEKTSWTWDKAENGLGKLSKMTSADGHSETYKYDQFGRLSKISTTPQLGPNPVGRREVYTTTFVYKTGRLVEIQYPKGTSEPSLSVHHEYSPEGLLVALYTSNGNELKKELAWQWKGVDERGRMNLEAAGNSLLSEYNFHPLNGLLEHIQTYNPNTSNILQAFDYTYDNNRNLLSQTDTVHGQTETFEHDELDRLTKSTVNGSDVTHFDYEANGNIKAIWKSAISSQGPPQWLYDPAHPHAVSQAYRDGKSYLFEHDKLGRQIRRSVDGNTSHVRYTSFNKPKLISPTDSPLDPQAVRFSYDGNERRILKDTAKERTLYIQGLYEKVTNNTTDLSVVKRHISNGARVVATVVHTEPQKGIIKGRWGSDIKYLHADRLGSPTLATTKDGTPDEYRSYDAFGRRRSPENWAEPPPSLKAPLTSGFTGHEEDEELGLVNMGGRIYDPTIARFLTPDPFVQEPFFSQSWNRYSYVFNNPLSFIDPSGYQACPPDASCKTTEGPSFIREYTPPAPNQSTVDGPPSTPNQDDPLGSSSSPEHFVRQVDPRVNVQILGDKYNPYSDPGRVSIDVFGSPPPPSPLLSLEQQKVVANVVGGITDFIPGTSTIKALTDESTDTTDIVLAVLGDASGLLGAKVATKGIPLVLGSIQKTEIAQRLEAKLFERIIKSFLKHTPEGREYEISRVRNAIEKYFQKQSRGGGKFDEIRVADQAKGVHGARSNLPSRHTASEGEITNEAIRSTGKSDTRMRNSLKSTKNREDAKRWSGDDD